MNWIILWTEGWIIGYGLINVYLYLLNDIYKEFNYFIDTKILYTNL